jgi:hypothetical protein
MDNGPLFDSTKAAEKRDAAVAQGLRAAHEEWKKAALAAIYGCAKRYKCFTTDQVEELLEYYGVSTHDTRALGGLMKRAEGHGWIEITDRTRPSRMPRNHRRPKRLWNSLIRG